LKNRSIVALLLQQMLTKVETEPKNKRPAEAGRGLLRVVGG
jgi:hypothetical protein